MASVPAERMASRKTALNSTHRKMGARMVEFGGWDMPLEYSGIVPEHMAVRTRAGLFDVSHMGEIEVKGEGALPLLQKVTCNDASRLQVSQAQYSGLMNPQGGFIDDLLIHKIADRHYLLCVNAARRETDFAWITEQNDTGADVRDVSDDYTQLAVQGPRSKAVLERLTAVDLGALKYYRFTHGDVCGVPSLVARTGYTGEDGFELYLPPTKSERVWGELLEAGKQEGILPCGLGARNTLRLEAGMALYGHDINEETTPLEANLQWIAKLKKGSFLGSEVLIQQAQEGWKRRLAGFQMIDRGIARDEAPVGVEDRQVGRVTSGSYTPFLKRSIGLAYLPSELASPGQRIWIEIRGNRAAAEVVPTPFYRKPKG